MFRLRTQSKTILQTLAATILFATIAAAQIPGLCNTGQTPRRVLGCTGVLVTPNPQGGGPDRDANWALAYPYPSALTMTHGPCDLKGFVKAWVDTPNTAWFPDSVSTESEWITPVAGETNIAAGWYVYRIKFPIPSVLVSGGVPTGITINGRLASDDATYGIYLESPAGSTKCSVVTSLPVPINASDPFQQWWDFSFANPIAIYPWRRCLLVFCGPE